MQSPCLQTTEADALHPSWLQGVSLCVDISRDLVNLLLEKMWSLFSNFVYQ